MITDERYRVFKEEPERIAALPRYVDSNGGSAKPKLWCMPGDQDLADEESRPLWLAARATLAVEQSRCWACGDKLGVFRVFVMQVRDAVLRFTQSLPMHLDCAQWMAVQLSDTDTPGEVSRTLVVWSTQNYGITRRFSRPMFEFNKHKPTTVTWWRDGRPATYDEGSAAISAAAAEVMPSILDDGDPMAAQDLVNGVMRLTGTLPGAPSPTPKTSDDAAPTA